MTLKNSIVQIDDVLNVNKELHIKVIYIIALIIISILAGGLLQTEYSQLPSFYEQINKTANSNHILTDGENIYFIAPYHINAINITNTTLCNNSNGI